MVPRDRAVRLLTLVRGHLAYGPSPGQVASGARHRDRARARARVWPRVLARAAARLVARCGMLGSGAQPNDHREGKKAQPGEQQSPDENGSVSRADDGDHLFWKRTREKDQGKPEHPRPLLKFLTDPTP